MATLRDIKKRIRAVVNTRQITKAMEMVAAARLRKAQMLVEQSRPYTEKMRLILEQISSASANFEHPFFEKRAVSNRALVVFTSDRGLCGSYNANVIRRTVQALNEPADVGRKLVLVGKKGEDFFKRRDWPITRVFKGMRGKMDYEVAQQLTDYLIGMFLSHEVDQVDLVYMHFLSTTSFKLGVSRFLPIEPPQIEDSPAGDYIFEPDPQHIFDTLMPAYARTIVQMALADALASEHGTRMIAMNMATKNAGEMIDALTLKYNKARQAAITKELLEIVSGAEALKG